MNLEGKQHQPCMSCSVTISLKISQDWQLDLPSLQDTLILSLVGLAYQHPVSKPIHLTKSAMTGGECFHHPVLHHT